jgi:L-seryl-tRNA(Ser) seleniumtransferase
MNCSPNSNSIGRGLKVNKEEMLGMMVAVEMYLKRDAEAEWSEWERRARLVATAAASRTGVLTEIYVPPIANHVPHVRVSWNRTELPVLARDVRARLREGDPSIEIIPGGAAPEDEQQQIEIGIWQMQPGDAEVVARRLREALDG